MLKDNCLLPANQSPEALCCELFFNQHNPDYEKLAIVASYHQHLRALL